jgi:hypothetical protein
MTELKNVIKRSVSKATEKLSKNEHLINEADLLEINLSLEGGKLSNNMVKGSRFTHAQNLQFTQVIYFG